MSHGGNATPLILDGRGTEHAAARSQSEITITTPHLTTVR